MEHDAATNQSPHTRAAAPARSAPGAATRRRGPGAVATALALAALLAALLAACGSSAKPTLSSAQVKQQTCKRVEAVLSDGPEPEADPVGYAQAQVLPLRQIHTTDVRLGGAIARLASAYQQFSTSNGAGHAKEAVSAASKTIKTLCPGIEL